MSTKSKLYLPILILNLLGIGVSLFGNVYCMAYEESGTFMIVSSVLAVLALMAALLYIFSGAKKDAAGSFRFFCYTFALSQLACIFNAAESEGTAGSVFCAILAVSFAMILTLALSKDLGKAKSFTLCAIIFVIALGLLIPCILAKLNVFELKVMASQMTLACVSFFSQLTLATVLFCCTYAKYVDKSSRGSK